MTPADAEFQTTPAGIQIVYYPKSHRYKIGLTDAADFDTSDDAPLRFVPSVSTILDKAISKNLTGWAERLTVLGLSELSALRGTAYVARLGPEAILKELHAHGLRYYQSRDAAAERGTNVHRAMEMLAEGTIPNLRDWPLEQRGYIQALAKFWRDYEPEVIHSELMVASWEFQYAGRLDLIAKTNRNPLPSVIDLKTSKAVRDSHHFQTAGYRRAADESGYYAPGVGAVVRVGEDGAYEFVESHATTEQFEALVRSHQAQKEFERTGKALAKEAKAA
jgi:hypothetical protein